jgi:hypothetical protein
MPCVPVLSLWIYHHNQLVLPLIPFLSEFGNWNSLRSPPTSNPLLLGEMSGVGKMRQENISR